MDHIPQSTKLYQPLKVPYLGSDEYHGPFHDYPERSGWNIEKMEYLLWLRRKPQLLVNRGFSLGFFMRCLVPVSCRLDSGISFVTIMEYIDDPQALHRMAIEGSGVERSPKVFITTSPLSSLLKPWSE
jgi:hypothetical protein